MKHIVVNRKKRLFRVFFLCIAFLLSACQGDNGSNDTANDEDPCLSPSVSDGQLLACGSLQISAESTGFLVLSDEGAEVHSRSVTVSLSNNGYFEASGGERLQGYITHQGIIQTGILSDISISNADILSIEISADGIITGEVNGQRLALGQIILSTFKRPLFLNDLGNGILGESANSGTPIRGAPNSGTLGRIITGNFELPAMDYILDLSVEGIGYLVLDNQGQSLYSKENGFILGVNDFLTDVDNFPTEYHLQGYLADPQGNITATLGSLQVPTSNQPPQPTGQMTLTLNLDGREGIIAGVFNPSDPITYSHQQSLNTYDSQGGVHLADIYFAKRNDDVWAMYVYIDDVNVVSAMGGAGAANPFFELNFGPGGAIIFTDPVTLTVDNWNPPGGVSQSPQSNFDIDVNAVTQLPADFSAGLIEQDGFPPGRRTSTHIDTCGVLSSNYNNGQSVVLGQLSLASFPSPSDLTLFDTDLYLESGLSGSPTIGASCQGGFGTIGGDSDL